MIVTHGYGIEEVDPASLKDIVVRLNGEQVCGLLAAVVPIYEDAQRVISDGHCVPDESFLMLKQLKELLTSALVGAIAKHAEREGRRNTNEETVH